MYTALEKPKRQRLHRWGFQFIFGGSMAALSLNFLDIKVKALYIVNGMMVHERPPKFGRLWIQSANGQKEQQVKNQPAQRVRKSTLAARKG